jgi:hypothetical protein
MGSSMMFQAIWLVSPVATLIALVMLLKFRRLTPAFPLLLIGLLTQFATGLGQIGFTMARMLGFEVFNSHEFISVFYQGMSMVGLAGKFCLLVGVVLVIRQLESRLSFLTQIVENQSPNEDRD